jgi:hypothetical protein
MTSAWPQNYYLFGQGLGVSSLVAVVPILVLLFLLAVMRRAAWVAALAGLAATVAMAIGAYGMSLRHTLSAAAYGASFGIFPISWIIFWALVLYQVTVRTAKFEVIKESIGAITSDTRLQALLIAFAFGAFLEGCAGFGTPVAVAAAMMVGLGFAPLEQVERGCWADQCADFFFAACVYCAGDERERCAGGGLACGTGLRRGFCAGAVFGVDADWAAVDGCFEFGVGYGRFDVAAAVLGSAECCGRCGAGGWGAAAVHQG